MITFFRKHMKWIMLTVAFVFIASMFYGVTASRSTGGGSRRQTGLAKVNGKQLDPARYREMFNRLLQQFGKEVSPSDMAFIENLALQQTIDFTLVLEQAKKKAKISNREVDMVISNIAQQQNFKSKKDMEVALKRMGITMSRFKKMVKEEMMVQKMMQKVKDDVKVSPDDLREVRASHILVSKETEAKDILKQVNNGGDFASLAKKYSLDPGSKIKGGDLGFFATGVMVEPFEQAAFSLKIGEVSKIVESPFGFHVIKVTDSKLRKFDGKEKDIEKAALAQKQEKSFQRWYSSLKQEAKVEIISSELKANQLRFQGKIIQAIEEYKKAIAANPLNPYLHIYLGDTYASIGKNELALIEYEEAVKTEGGNYHLYLVLAQAYVKNGQKNNAIETYEKASMVAADNKDQHEQLKKAFQKLNAWKQVAQEQKEIRRIEKKEKFEQDLQGTN